jgi:DNA-binding MarR family transcriptional regulator
MDRLLDVLLHEKPVKMLITLRNNTRNYATTLAKAADCTYSHTMKIIDVLERKGLVESEKSGRIRYLKLTKLGEEIAAIVDELVRAVNKIDERRE